MPTADATTPAIPGAGPDRIWWATPLSPGDDFESGLASVRGTDMPLVGDFDGNGADDVFWYG